jgi:hypothetical protein
MKTIVLIALLAAAGCKKSSSASGPDCDGAIAKGMESVLATVKSRAPSPQIQESLTEMVGKMRTTLTQRCNEDKWSPETVECFTKLSSQAEMQACEQKLTNEQRTKLRGEMRQIMSSMRMNPGGPGHPTTLGGSGTPPAPTPGADTPPANPAAANPPAANPPAGATPPASPPPATPPPPSGAAPAAGSSASGW